METRRNSADGSASAADKVISYIREGISDKKFRVGTKLPTEVELCAITGVSRSGVREAMKVLEANGIVNIRRGDGTYLSGPEDITFFNSLVFKLLLRDTSFQEMCAFRESIELGLVRLVIMNHDEEDLRKLEFINERMRQIASQPVQDNHALHQVELEFHSALAAAAKNDMLCDIYMMLFDVFGPLILRNYQVGQDGLLGYQTHVATIEAIRTRDFVQLGAAIKQNVSLFGDWIKYAHAKEILSDDLQRKSD